MGFSQPDTAVKKERIVGFARRLSHGERGGVCKGIVASYECVKGILRVESQFAIDRVSIRKPVTSFGFVGNTVFGSICAGRRIIDMEFDLYRLARHMSEHIAHQTKVVILKPHLTKIVGHIQRKTVAFQRACLERSGGAGDWA